MCSVYARTFDFAADLPTTPPFEDAVAIYVLVDPRDTATIRYVGKTGKPHSRLVNHCWDKAPGNSQRAQWVRRLLTEGVKPLLRIIAYVARDDWTAAEIAAIAQARAAFGDLLTNATIGGGATRGFRHTAETRQKIAAALKGRRYSPETRAKMSASQKKRTMGPVAREALRRANTGRKPSEKQLERLRQLNQRHKEQGISPEAVAKMAAKLRGRTLSEEHKAKLRGRKHSPEEKAKRVAALRGRPCSAETRARISAAQKGKQISPESIAKMAASLRGRTLSDEHKARLSVAQKARRERERQQRLQLGDIADGLCRRRSTFSGEDVCVQPWPCPEYEQCADEPRASDALRE